MSDDDGHYYIVLADRRFEFNEWLESEEAMDGGEPPPFATRINLHPVNHTFTDWREDE